MSDLHLTAHKNEIWGVNTYMQFEKALHAIRTIEKVDCIIVTGDIADDGKAETYLYADKLFKDLGIRTFWCYGNHDNVSTMQNCALSFVQVCNEAVLDNHRFVFVNSVLKDEENLNKNCSKGYIAVNEIQRLKNIINYRTDLPIIIAMHHPSIEPGGWLSNKILTNRCHFNEIVTCANVKCVLFGHIHSFMMKKHNEVIFTASSSTAFAFDKELKRYEIAKGNEGFSQIKIDGNIEINNIKI